MRRKTITRVLLRRANLRRPFPEGFASRLEGQTIRSLRRRGKYLLLDLSSGDMLLIHLGMSGSFRIDEDGSPNAHDHVVFQLSNGSVVTFNDPRRFGLMDIIQAEGGGEHRALRSMGAEPLDASFDAVTLARACANRKTTLKVALLDQRVVAGVGNIYASEALHRAGLSPRRRASTIATTHRTAAPGCVPIDQRDQSGPAQRDRTAGAPVSIRRLPRVRPGRREMLPAGMRRNHSSHPAGGTLDVLLSEMSALNGTNLRPFDAETQTARRRCRPLRAVGATSTPARGEH